ncbi:MAG: hypothetical protein ILA26_04425 [Methanobrevibacter sp.]|uniref:hypothetical protein n=1 Tax=Methanobrevibacter sp. TaxID=66852 RepID=UPI001B4B0FB2|nr:hypothetical protein [Methanobrevibacter sp.]MBP3791257.1 hypothetical protein [Methanobrevibacter sp.]
MGNTIKLVSGFILFVIGILIAYEASVYNLIDILLIVGVIIAIVGIILMASYFVDSNADRTTNMIKEFIESREGDSSSFMSNKKSNENEGPLKIRRDYNDYDDEEYGELVFEDYPDEGPSESYLNSQGKDYLGSSLKDNPKAVLNVVPQKESDVNFDNQLEFTPHYGKPLKVTRSPKRRSSDYEVNDVQEFIVEPVRDNTATIQQALSEPEHVLEPVLEHPRKIVPEVPARDIKIDVNNPESLPVPKSLNSYILSDDGVLTSREAFESLAVNVNKEIMLEIPSLKDLSDRFLSHVPTIYSRVIINEFDVSDMSYMFLISSLLKQGVHIKTVPRVHAINLITDDSYAMIISEGKDDMEYGAIYNDRNSISNIRADFEKTWNIASNLDDAVLMASAGGVA